MGSIDDDIQRVIQDSPILLDLDFQKEHPGFIEVVTFIDSVARTTIRTMGYYEFYKRLGINSIGEYVELVEKGQPEAVRCYERVRDTLDLG